MCWCAFPPHSFQSGCVLPWKQCISPFLKTCIVGRPGVGKTCLIRALAGEPFDQKSRQTNGIVLRRILLESVPVGDEQVSLFQSCLR